MAQSPADANPDDFGGLSQADIDAALASAGGEEPAAAPPDDSGGLSQADIDNALAGAADAAAAPDDRLDSEGRPFDDTAAAMAAAIAEEKTAASLAATDQDPLLEEVDMPDFGDGDADAAAVHGIDLLHDVTLRVRIELGRTKLDIEEVLRLGEGSVVELDKLAGDPVDVFVNDRLVARGEVLVLNDNFCVRVGDIISDANERLVG